jgi:hypothetical protein
MSTLRTSPCHDSAIAHTVELAIQAAHRGHWSKAWRLSCDAFRLAIASGSAYKGDVMELRNALTSRDLTRYPLYI